MKLLHFCTASLLLTALFNAFYDCIFFLVYHYIKIYFWRKEGASISDSVCAWNLLILLLKVFSTTRCKNLLLHLFEPSFCYIRQLRPQLIAYLCRSCQYNSWHSCFWKVNNLISNQHLRFAVHVFTCTCIRVCCQYERRSLND